MEAKLTRVTQNSDKTVPSDRELYQAASPKTIGYTLVYVFMVCSFLGFFYYKFSVAHAL
jgi:hypothetical protein